MHETLDSTPGSDYTAKQNGLAVSGRLSAMPLATRPKQSKTVGLTEVNKGRNKNGNQTRHSRKTPK